ncbi:putative MFS transporter, AGZA family, xanthine/uracil permease [Thermoflavimicrobium dichotomicum]|uniref:Putative MFS transporter, AGZA family, xanthine/uracil permease n=1 Tax=Thermoflavimicrobium dichotomicum TaxID=46223 RepID=A0A1I3QY38_9BACL|nr:putative MFS transporter, AGZA family, xanthine/uracil permease [Thermoflavimicrobium dichotomicum]
MAGVVSFFTIVYIVVINASILADAGIPFEAGVIATVLSSFVGCFLMGLWSNTPIILVPGMGVNALFVYTIVKMMGLSWQEALAAVSISGIIFMAVAFTRLSDFIMKAIPNSLKEATTVGIGIFLTFIGLQKGGIVVANKTTFVSLGNLSSPQVIVTVITLMLTLVLFVRGVSGHFLISMACGTVIALLFDLVDLKEVHPTNLPLKSYWNVFAHLSLAKWTSLIFWIATFSLAMVVVFENIGLVHGYVQLLNRPDARARILQANAISVVSCGLFGTSPTVSTVETVAGITVGGRTGLTAITTGCLFLVSLLIIPYIKLIPDSAIAPVLILIGGLMIQSIQNIDFKDLTEGLPAFFIIVLIPFTYSIVDGIAFGFIAYPLLKLALGRKNEVAKPLYFIATLFLLSLILH